jgi:plasmid maintenance system antidote protein VapI
MHRNLTVVVRDSLAKAGHLTRQGGLTSRAADILGISRSTLTDRLRNDRLTADDLYRISRLLGTTTDAIAVEAGQ